MCFFTYNLINEIGKDGSVMRETRKVELRRQSQTHF